MANNVAGWCRHQHTVGCLGWSGIGGSAHSCTGPHSTVWHGCIGACTGLVTIAVPADRCLPCTGAHHLPFLWHAPQIWCQYPLVRPEQSPKLLQWHRTSALVTIAAYANHADNLIMLLTVISQIGTTSGYLQVFQATFMAGLQSIMLPHVICVCLKAEWRSILFGQHGADFMP